MKKISALIFDLGGVLLNLDQDRTLRAYNKLGIDLDKVNAHSSVFIDFEVGKLDENQFRILLLSLVKQPLTDVQIDEAWNAMLLHTTEKSLELLQKLRKHVDIYLLSNTNSIHITYFRNYVDENFGLENWDKCFNKQFLSYEMGCRKPNEDAYLYVLNEIGRTANECLFIDDSLQNIKGAQRAGISTLHALHPFDEAMYNEIVKQLKAY
jgi:glucose-1-phosphatase